MIIYYRDTSLPKLNTFADREKKIWANMPEMKYYASIDELRKAIEKASYHKEAELDRKTVRLGVYLGQLMLTWRQRAQKYEKDLDDPRFKYHHSQRINSSVPGTLMKPSDDSRPDAASRSTTPETMRQLDELLDLLSGTACNWATFHNKSSLVMKWVRIAMVSLEFRELYDEVLQDRDTRPIFNSFSTLLAKTENPTVKSLCLLPEADYAKVKYQLHPGFLHSGLDQIDRELAQGLTQLKDLVRRFGASREDKQLSINAMKGYHALAMAFTEMAMWKKAVCSGPHQARYGNIKETTLREEMERLVDPLPDLSRALSSQEVAEDLQVRSVGQVLASISEELPSNSVEKQWGKDSKRRRVQAVREMKKQEKQYVLQRGPVVAPPKAKRASKASGSGSKKAPITPARVPTTPPSSPPASPIAPPAAPIAPPAAPIAPPAAPITPTAAPTTPATAVTITPRVQAPLADFQATKARILEAQTKRLTRRESAFLVLLHPTF